MSDYDSQLPVRSKQDADERVLIKIQDGQDPGGVDKTMEVSEKKAHVRNFSKDSDGNDQEQLLSQEGHSLTNGDYDATNNKRPSSQGLIASVRDAAPGETTMNQRPTAVDGDDDKTALDVAISDSNGNRIDQNNPLATYSVDNPGVEIEDGKLDEDVTKKTGGVVTTVTHEYTVTAAKELRKLSASCSSAGLAKFVLQVEDGVGAGTYTIKDIQFNSTSNPNVVLGVKIPAPIAAGVKVQVLKSNLDNGDTDLWSIINGVEVTP